MANIAFYITMTEIKMVNKLVEVRQSKWSLEYIHNCTKFDTHTHIYVCVAVGNVLFFLFVDLIN